MINFNDILKETLELYRLENVKAAIKMMEDNKIYLTTVGAPGEGYESEISHGKQFFLSMMRSKYGNYIKGGAFSNPNKPLNRDMVIIHFDGDKLRANYKIVPVEYWQWGPERSENEERLLSDKQYIPDATKYIIDMFVYLGQEEDEQNISNASSYYRTVYHELDLWCKKRNVDVYYYGPQEKEYFKKQIKNKGHKNIDDVWQFPNAVTDKDAWWGSSYDHHDKLAMKYVADWYFKHEEISPKNEEEKKIIDMWRKYILYYKNDFVAQFANLIHNNKRHKYWSEHQMVADMFRDARKRGMKTTLELYDHLNKIANEFFEELGKTGQGPRAPWDPENPDKPTWYNNNKHNT